MLEGSSSRLNVYGLRRIARSAEEDHRLVEKLAPWSALTTTFGKVCFLTSGSRTGVLIYSSTGKFCQGKVHKEDLRAQ